MKNYMRGFGIGVLFVTILFVVIRKPEALTDVEVQSRAARLGMLTEQEAEEKRLTAIRESELKWKDELEKQKEEYEALLKQKNPEEEKGEKDENGQSDQTAGNPEEDKSENDGEKNNGESEQSNDGESEQNNDGEKNNGEPEQNNDEEKNNGESEQNNGEEKNNDELEQNNDEEKNNGETEQNNDDKRNENDKSTENGQGSDGSEAGANAVPGLVKIEIVSGMTADQVALMLEESGVIESASEFKQYLKEQNRQTLIQIGTFELRQGEDLETVVNIITRR